jgi:hypothetical protein
VRWTFSPCAGESSDHFAAAQNTSRNRAQSLDDNPPLISGGS